MAKNMTRKGLALAAAVGLITSGFAGSVPASAAPTSMTLSAKAGTGFDTVLGATFNLKLLHVGGTTSDLVKYFVEGAVASDFAAIYTDEGIAPTTDAIADDISAGVATVSAAELTSVIKNAGLELNSGNFDYLSIKLDDAEVTATTSIKLTPFIDTVVADDKITTGEAVGNTITITFHKASEVTATVSSLTLAPVGSTSGSDNTTAVVTLDKNVNMADTVGGVGKVEFSENAGSAQVDNSVAYDSTEGGYVAQIAASTIGVNDGDVISAKAFVEGETTGGATTTKVGVAGTISAISSISGVAGSSYLASDTSNGTTADAIRAGAGSVTLETTVSATSPAVAAGQTVSFKVAEQAANGKLDSGAAVTAGGKSFSNTSVTTVQSVSFDVVADADGVASVTIDYTGVKAGNQLVVTATAVGASVFTQTKTLTATNSVAYQIHSSVDGGDGTDAGVYTMSKGTAGSVTYYLTDQFGQVPVGTFQANAQVTGGLVINQRVSFANGVAVVSWTDNSTGAASRTITMDVEKLGTSTYADVSPALNSNVALNVDVLSAAVPTPSVVSVTNSASAAIDMLKATLVEGDKRILQSSKAWSTIGSNAINGAVISTAGGAVSGASVTVSAPGMLFSNAAKTHFALDSITVHADAAGQYKVFYNGNTAGKQTITVTAGSASKTTTTTFNAALKTEVAKVTVTAPAAAEPGKTFAVKAVLSDKYGNPVAVPASTTGGEPFLRVSYPATNPGLVVGSLPTSSSADGSLAFAVLLGSNDTGSAVVTVTYDKNGDGDVADAGDLSTQATIVVGTAGNVGAYSSWTKKLDDNSAKIYAKNVVGAGKVQFFLNGEEIAWVRATSAADSKLRSANGAAYLVRTVEFADGKNVLEVYVDGVRTTRTAYTK